MSAFIRTIEYDFPNGVLTNEMLTAEYPEWSLEKIEQKTGIIERRIASKDECASDIGVRAAEKIFISSICNREEIDYILLCTQSPDYFLPTTACIMQKRLGLSTNCGALDFNLGCSGYIYGLGLAKGLVETRQARNILLITAETYSKHIHPGDKSVRTLFGDAATATLIQCKETTGKKHTLIGPFVYGTDGAGGENLIVRTGGFRCPRNNEPATVAEDKNGNLCSEDNLYMNGSEIFTFTLRAVPATVRELLVTSGKSMIDIDLFVFHQANRFMLEHLRDKLKIPAEKFYMSFMNYGNTVSSTIPIALKDAQLEGKVKQGDLVMLVGFGVGYSWGATLVQWTN